MKIGKSQQWQDKSGDGPYGVICRFLRRETIEAIIVGSILFIGGVFLLWQI